jgi:hypothetical protein
MTTIPKPRRLDQVLDEHTDLVRQDTSSLFRVFKASGNIYREHHLRAIDNHDRMYVPIVDGIERSDLRIKAAPFDACARLLQREGIIS